MKNFTLTLFLFASLHTFAQVPDYFANEPTWLVHTYGGTPWTFFYDGKKLIFIDGDTTINNQSYYKLYQTGYYSEALAPPFPPPIDPQDYFDHVLFGLHRQEGRAIYAYDSNTQSDYLLISYEYQVGDIVQSSVLNPTPVEAIDSMLVGSEYRRMFYVDTANGDYVLEGIGYLTSAPDMFSSMYADYPSFGIESLMNFCYAQNENALYPQQPGGAVCTTEHLAVEQLSDALGFLYFNPNEKTIVVPEPEGEVTLVVRDVCGKLLAQGNGNSLSVAALPAGYYFATMEGRHTLYFVIAD